MELIYNLSMSFGTPLKGIACLGEEAVLDEVVKGCGH
jgi:hypothetical protein